MEARALFSFAVFILSAIAWIQPKLPGKMMECVSFWLYAIRIRIHRQRLQPSLCAQTHTYKFYVVNTVFTLLRNINTLKIMWTMGCWVHVKYGVWACRNAIEAKPYKALSKSRIGHMWSEPSGRVRTVFARLVGLMEPIRCSESTLHRIPENKYADACRKSGTKQLWSKRTWLTARWKKNRPVERETGRRGAQEGGREKKGKHTRMSG